MGRFESYSKRKFKVSMVLFACMSWPWKAALTKPFKNQTHSQSQFSPHIHSENSSLHWFPIPTQQLLWTQLRWEGGTRAGAAGGALVSSSGCTGRAVTPLPAGQVPAEHLHMDLVQLLLAWRAVGRQAAAQSQREAEQQPRPSSHPGSSDSGSKSWHAAGAFWHLRYFHALYDLCKLKCQGVINYVAVHSLHFIYKKGLKTGSKKAQTWEIT